MRRNVGPLGKRTILASQYVACVPALALRDKRLQRAVKEHKLEELIHQAREENPLNSLEDQLDRAHSP